MREYELIIDEALKRGLSPEENLPTNSQFLKECLGFRIGKGGIERFVPLTNPVPGSVDMHYLWPFPQFITGEKFNFLIIKDPDTSTFAVFSVSDNHATATLIANSGLDDDGWLMEVADFGEYALMTNGLDMVVWDVVNSEWDVVESTGTFPRLGTFCNFKGQLVGGNARTTWHDCDSTFYVWSKIGYADFTPDAENEAGYRRDPFGGEVYHTRRLGDFVVGYSSKGVVALRPVNEPAPTFGFVELSDVGLINRGAMNGNLRRQIYVGDDYAIREVTSEGVKELNYSHHMLMLAGEDIIVNYDPGSGDFFIGNSEKTFLLSANGLTEIQQHPSAVWRRNKQSYMLPDTEDSTFPTIATLPFDFTYGGMKTIQTLELSGEGYVDGEGSVDYYNNGAWITKPYTPVNNQGIATIVASGEQFRFRTRFDSLQSNFKLAHLKARYKMTDLRGIRGVYAPPLRGQA